MSSENTKDRHGLQIGSTGIRTLDSRLWAFRRHLEDSYEALHGELDPEAEATIQSIVRTEKNLRVVEARVKAAGAELTVEQAMKATNVVLQASMSRDSMINRLGLSGPGVVSDWQFDSGEDGSCDPES